MLAFRDSREQARRALAALGDEALAFLADSMADEELPDPVRRHVPRSLARFDPPRAARVLLDRLPAEPDGVVRFKILRALGQLRARRPGLALDHSILDAAIDETVARIFRQIEWRVALAAAPEAARPIRDGSVLPMILDLITDRERHALERLFRLFSLRFPREDFKRIHAGVVSGGRTARASARELLANVLRPPLREAMVGMLDEVPDALRLAAGRRYHRARGLSRNETLRELLEQGGVTLRCLVAYHVAELRLEDLRADLVRHCGVAPGLLAEAFGNAMYRLDHPGEESFLVAPR
jgi:hypothetical protein